MAATKEDIRRWLQRGITEGATHVVVVCDTFDWDDYPVYVTPEQKIQEVIARYGGRFAKPGPDMQKIIEVYSLSLPIEPQLNERQAWHDETVTWIE